MMLRGNDYPLSVIDDNSVGAACAPSHSKYAHLKTLSFMILWKGKKLLGLKSQNCGQLAV